MSSHIIWYILMYKNFKGFGEIKQELLGRLQFIDEIYESYDSRVKASTSENNIFLSQYSKFTTSNKFSFLLLDI